MKIFAFVLPLFLSMILIGCKTEKNEVAKNPVKNQQEITVVQNNDLLSLPEDLFLKVYNATDYLDVIFEELPFSMSQDNKKGIQQLMKYIDKRPPNAISSGCPLFAQQFYQKEGELLIEADVFHSEGCFYYVFKHEGKSYYNAMLPEGIQFFNNLKKRQF